MKAKICRYTNSKQTLRKNVNSNIPEDDSLNKELLHRSMAVSCEHGNETSGPVKYGDFLV
jgi:hypothetical protein